MTDSGTIPPDDAAMLTDRAYLESLIDGSGDLLAEDTFTRMEPMFERYPEGSEMFKLLEKAATIYSDAAMAVAQRALATTERELPDDIIRSILDAQYAARSAAADAVERLQGRFDFCGWAELRLTIERDSLLWTGFFRAAERPGAEQVFKVVPSGENEIELSIADLNFPPQGSSVQASAQKAALQVLKERLGVTGWVNTIID